MILFSCVNFSENKPNSWNLLSKNQEEKNEKTEESLEGDQSELTSSPLDPSWGKGLPAPLSNSCRPLHSCVEAMGGV